MKNMVVVFRSSYSKLLHRFPLNWSIGYDVRLHRGVGYKNTVVQSNNNRNDANFRMRSSKLQIYKNLYFDFATLYCVDNCDF